MLTKKIFISFERLEELTFKKYVAYVDIKVAKQEKNKVTEGDQNDPTSLFIIKQ